MATLAEASLDAVERRVVDRLIDLLKAELGDDLRAVWLYGSRARGERPGEESDVDLLILARGGDAHLAKIIELRNQAVEGEDTSPVWFSTLVADPEWLQDRRAIDSFFIREVDRDKIVLYGDDGGEPPAERSSYEGVKPRTQEFLEQADEYLGGAKAALAAGNRSPALSSAYDAMRYAADAALSEEDRYAKTHSGTWHLFHVHFVVTGRFPAELHAAAQSALEKAVDADYKAIRPEPVVADRTVATAERFVAAVNDLIGA